MRYNETDETITSLKMIALMVGMFAAIIVWFFYIANHPYGIY